MWYYDMLNVPEDTETATDGFRDYLLIYFEEDFVKSIANHAYRNKVNIMAPPNKTLPHPRRESYIDRAMIEDEAQLVATLWKLDPRKPDEYMELVECIFAMYGEEIDEEKIKKRNN